MPTETKPDTSNRGSWPIKRRKFLGLGLSGFAGLSLQGLARFRAQAAAGKSTSKAAEAIQTASETTYWDRTDRFEEKLKLLEAAWQRKDFRLARALAHSLRNTAIQAQAEEESPGTPLAAAASHEPVDSLPSPWRNWARGWKYYKTLILDETIGQERRAEPVQVLLSFLTDQVTSLTRELRVALLNEGALREVPCQVISEVRRGNERLCKLLFMADSPARQKQAFLEHKAEGLPELKHSGAPTMSYRWHGQLWSRYPLPGRHVPAGAVLHEKNAYIALPFTGADGPRMIEELRRRLVNPLVAAAGDLPKPITAKEAARRLARPGEAGDSPIPKQSLWDALRDCKDAQFYTADINVVDLGLVYDVRVRGDVVTVVMAMPHRGRPRLGYFTHGSISVHPTLSLPVRERLMKVPGVRQVVVEQTWEPGWSSNQLTNEGRRKFGLL